jgi:fucose permease
MTGFHELAPAAIASAFGFGMILAILGSLGPFLSEKMEIPPSPFPLPPGERGRGEGERVRGWISVVFLALIPFVFLSGIATDQWGWRVTLVAGSLLAGLGLFGLSVGRDVWMTWLCLTGMASGASALSVGAIAIMPRAFLGTNAASANLGLVFVPLGSLITGALTPFILSRLGMRPAVNLLALVCLIPAFVVTLTPAEALPQDPSPLVPKLQFGNEVVSHPALWLISLAFLLYGPLEGSLGSWAAAYLAQAGLPERRVGWWVGGFWLAFTVSRIGAACLEYRYLAGAEAWVIIALASLAAVAIGGLAGTHHRAHSAMWLLLIGLLLGPIFPNLVGILYSQFGAGEVGTAYGVMFLLGGAGGLLLPPIMSTYARRTSLRAALRLPILISILLAGGGLALALSK